MNLISREQVVQLAVENHLSITIRPDGSIIGLKSDLDTLRKLVSP